MVQQKVFHTGDVGIDFRGLILDENENPDSNLSGATIVCEFIKPDKSTTTQNGTVDTGGLPAYNVIYSHSGASILDQDGLWGFRFRVTYSDSDVGKQVYKYFKVNA